MEKDLHKVDRIMRSLDLASQAIPDPKFVERMQDWVVDHYPQKRLVSFSVLVSVAASFILLVVVNFLLFQETSTERNSSAEAIEYEEQLGYDLIPTKSIYHD